ncbi:hypothetical protein GCM10012285_54700 [Streptomyces kronopolitis]|uniref:Uncharacterized protein n=1 Tax=Streptomyces kronopolitis TaxID=1612435 RepID=A0ABQ2JXK5_9ACTN|nr:hypothetical protein GCM10012285_54700 [Streptomyces kronopolitis]
MIGGPARPGPARPGSAGVASRGPSAVAEGRARPPWQSPAPDSRKGRLRISAGLRLPAPMQMPDRWRRGMHQRSGWGNTNKAARAGSQLPGCNVVL